MRREIARLRTIKPAARNKAEEFDAPQIEELKECYGEDTPGPSA